MYGSDYYCLNTIFFHAGIIFTLLLGPPALPLSLNYYGKE